MYCPKCDTEYIEGITVCADCQGKLVDEIPPEPSEPDYEYVDYVELMFADSGTRIFLQSVLEGNHITCYCPTGPFAALGNVLMVNKDEMEMVEDIMEDLGIKYQGGH